MRPKNTGPYDEAAIAVMAHDTLAGLKYMHKDMLIHRDIKGKPPIVLSLLASYRNPCPSPRTGRSSRAFAPFCDSQPATSW